MVSGAETSNSRSALENAAVVGRIGFGSGRGHLLTACARPREQHRRPRRPCRARHRRRRETFCGWIGYLWFSHMFEGSHAVRAALALLGLMFLALGVTS